MKHIIQKALAKASTKKLDQAGTADLIMEYLDIAGELSVPQQSAPPPLPKEEELWEDEENYPVKPVQLNKVIAKAAEATEWDADSLSEWLRKFIWDFSVQPEGWQKTLEFGGVFVREPRGFPGVAVVFKCLNDDTIPKQLQDIKLFFPYHEAHSNPLAELEALKATQMQLLRKGQKVESKTVQIATAPAMPAMAPSLDGKPTAGIF